MSGTGTWGSPALASVSDMTESTSFKDIYFGILHYSLVSLEKDGVTTHYDTIFSQGPVCDKETMVVDLLNTVLQRSPVPLKHSKTH